MTMFSDLQIFCCTVARPESMSPCDCSWVFWEIIGTELMPPVLLNSPHKYK
jgi:hypothetical protein